MNSDWQTKITLIQRAKSQSDEQAWDDFYSYYQGFISMVIYKLKMGSVDQEDIRQAILLKIWQKLSLFDAAGKAQFRSWLYTLIRNAMIDYLRKYEKNKKHHVDIQSEDGDLPRSLAPRTEPEIDELIENEWKAHITRLAMANAAQQFSEKTMQVFQMSMLNKDVSEISQELELSSDTIYTLKNRVKNFLVRQIKELRNELEL